MIEILTSIVWVFIVAFGYWIIKVVIGTDFIVEAILSVLLLILALLFSGRIANFILQRHPHK